MTDFSKNWEKKLREWESSPEASTPLPPDESIPADFGKFYEDFGAPFVNPLTRQKVDKLADYQLEVVKALHEKKRVICLKSQKIGLTSTLLIAMLHLALLPTKHPLSTRGMQTIIVAQSLQHAEQHLRDARNFMRNSQKYAGFLITQSGTDGLFRDEATKVSSLVLRNPEVPVQYTTLLALGITNSGSLMSLKNVKAVLLSDVVETEHDYEQGIKKAESRLAQSEGVIALEAPPTKVPAGFYYDLWQGALRGSNDYYPIHLPASLAVKSGVLRQETLDRFKRSLGLDYARLFEALFISPEGSVFNSNAVDACVEEYPLKVGSGRKVISIDPAFGHSKNASKFGVLVAEKNEGIVYVKYAEQFTSPNAGEIGRKITEMYKQYGCSVCLIDASQQVMINELKSIRLEQILYNKKLGEMTVNTTSAINERKVKLHPQFADLIYQLKSVPYNEEGNPDKEQVSFDIGDAFMQAVDYLLGVGSAGAGVVVDDEGRVITRPSGRIIAQTSGGILCEDD